MARDKDNYIVLCTYVGLHCNYLQTTPTRALVKCTNNKAVSHNVNKHTVGSNRNANR